MADDRRRLGWAGDEGILVTQCLLCRHLAEGPSFTCNAFPMAIPTAIIENRYDHRRPHPGDNGIQFAPAEDASAADLARLDRERDSLPPNV